MAQLFAFQVCLGLQSFPLFSVSQAKFSLRIDADNVRPARVLLDEKGHRWTDSNMINLEVIDSLWRFYA